MLHLLYLFTAQIKDKTQLKKAKSCIRLSQNNGGNSPGGHCMKRSPKSYLELLTKPYIEEKKNYESQALIQRTLTEHVVEVLAKW